MDERDEPDRFVVTGSQNLLLVEAVAQTLAGRAAWLRLHPLSLAELRERPPFDPLRLDRAEPARLGPPPAHRLWETPRN